MIGACGSSGDDGDPGGASAEPRRGGILRAGLSGSSNESLNPNTVEFSSADVARYLSIFDPLTLLVGGGATMVLAESIEPNADATRWTVRLRDGVTFHDGKPLTAADAVFSLKSRALDPKSTYVQAFEDLQARDIRRRDRLSFEVPLKRPRGDFPELIAGLGSCVLPEGIRNFSKPAGSGAFVLETYDPGRTALLRGNPDYFRGAPPLEGLEIRSVSDPGARANALRGGQLDFVKDLSFPAARAAQADPALQVILGGDANAGTVGVTMNTGLAPFDDPNVRTAFRLAADRQAILDTALFGFGEIGNDIVGKGLPGYDDALPQREHDPKRAQSLLAAAGPIEVSIRAAQTTSGVLEGVQVYIEQLKAVGVNARLARESVDTFYGDLGKNNSTPILSLNYINRPILRHIGTWCVSSALLNTQGWTRPAFDRAYAEALATPNPGRRQEILDDLQRQLYDEGGDVVWAYVQGPDGARAGVRGIEYAETAPLFSTASLG